MAEDLIRKGLKLSHIRLLAALVGETNLSLAAKAIGISQPAASRLASEVDRIIGGPLYTRIAGGICLTPEGASLARRAARMLQEVDLAGREIDELRSGSAGTVRVGSVTGPAVEFLLPAVRSFRLTHPEVSVGIDVGTSDHLMPKLLDGTLDFVFARRPGGLAATEFVERRLVPERISFAVRDGHPLEGESPPSLKDLLGFDWVLPLEGAILRTTMEQILHRHNLKLPDRVLSTSSFLITLAAVAQTNAVAPMAAAVAEAGGFAGKAITSLSVSEPLEVEAYSYFQRSGTNLTPAAQVLAQLIIDNVAYGSGPDY